MRAPSWVTRRRFHLARLWVWCVQVPIALSLPVLQSSLPYLIFLSLAALIESAGTDYDQARQAEQQADGHCPACRCSGRATGSRSRRSPGSRSRAAG